MTQIDDILEGTITWNKLIRPAAKQDVISEILEGYEHSVVQDILSASENIRANAAVVQPVKDITFIDFSKRKETPIYEIIRDFVLPTPPPVPITPQPITKDIVDRINTQTDDGPKLDLKNINPNYKIIITEGMDDFPFLLNKDMLDGVHKATSAMKTLHEKSRGVFDYIQANVRYGRSRRNVGYRNSEEVLRQGEGICGEMAYLYVTLARSLGLESNYVEVLVDNQGKKVFHACATAKVNGRSVLVDPAYHTYDIHHKNYRVLSDREASELFKQWRRT
jgi:transglutaminase-like putative cysteine protease